MPDGPRDPVPTSDTPGADVGRFGTDFGPRPPTIEEYAGYVDEQETIRRNTRIVMTAAASITERQLAEQWPDMGFDPNSDEPVTWIHDPANVHTTPRMQRAQEVADRLNGLRYPGGYLSRALDDADSSAAWMQRYREVLADHVTIASARHTLGLSHPVLSVAEQAELLRRSARGHLELTPDDDADDISEQEAALRRIEQGWVDGVHVSNPQITPARTLGIPSEPTDTYGYEVGRVSTPASSTLCWADDWSGSGRYGSHECGRMADPNSALGLCDKHEADKARFNEERGPAPARQVAQEFEEELTDAMSAPLVPTGRGTFEAVVDTGRLPSGAFDVLIEGDHVRVQPAGDGSLVILEGGTLDLGVIRPPILHPEACAELYADLQPVREVIASIAQAAVRAVNGAAEAITTAIAGMWPGVVRGFGQIMNAYRPGSYMDGPGYAEHYLTGHRWRDPETREQWRVAGRPGDRHWIRTGPRRARWWK